MKLFAVDGRSKMEMIEFNKNEIMTIYTDIESNTFGAGYILGVDDSCLLLRSIDCVGEDDGLILYRLQEIVKMERDTLYCQKLQRLIKIKNSVFKDYDFPQRDYIKWLLNESLNNNKMLFIQLLQSQQCDVIGIVTKVYTGKCFISQINDSGQSDGECVFRIEDISSIKIDSRENKAFELLRKNTLKVKPSESIKQRTNK